MDLKEGVLASCLGMSLLGTNSEKIAQVLRDAILQIFDKDEISYDDLQRACQMLSFMEDVAKGFVHLYGVDEHLLDKQELLDMLAKLAEDMLDQMAEDGKLTAENLDSAEELLSFIHRNIQDGDEIAAHCAENILKQVIDKRIINSINLCNAYNMLSYVIDKKGMKQMLKANEAGKEDKAIEELDSEIENLEKFISKCATSMLEQVSGNFEITDKNLGLVDAILSQIPDENKQAELRQKLGIADQP